jgi:hypothetical protein
MISVGASLDMNDELAQLFERIENGAELLTNQEEDLVYRYWLKLSTLKLKKEALEEFSDRQDEDIEWDAFNARTSRQEILQDLKHSRLDEAKPTVDTLLKNHKVAIDTSSAVYNQLLRAILRAKADVFANAELIVKGDLENPQLKFDTDPVVAQLDEEKSPSVTQANEIIKPFVEPKKTNDVAIAMVEYGNRYFKENNKVPSHSELSNYMLDKGGQALKLSYDPIWERYAFGDDYVSKRGFKDRYKSYLAIPKEK